MERIEFESLLFEGEGQQLTILEESGSSTPVIKVEPSEHVDMAADTASDILASIFGAEEEILPFGQERERMDFTMPGSPVFALKVESPDNGEFHSLTGQLQLLIIELCYASLVQWEV